MSLQISHHAEKLINNAILITGAARSGTTITEKIIHSFHNVECIHEPPLLFSLIPMIDEMSPSHWDLLFKTYLFEDFFVGAKSGRRLNFNTHDDSSIIKVKSSETIQNRLTRSWPKGTIIESISDEIIAFKMPDISPFIPEILRRFPNMRVITTRRDYRTTISSLLNKKWFCEEALESEKIWPYKQLKKFKIPFWVADSDVVDWIDMSEIERCAYYFITMNENIQSLNHCHEVWYEDLVIDPNFIVNDLCKFLNCQKTESTQKILDSVSVQETTQIADLSSLNVQIRCKLEALSKRLVK